MNSNSDKNREDFKSSDEAFDFLVNQRLDEKRKAEWARELGPGPEDKEEEQRSGRSISRRIILIATSVAAAVILIGGFFYLMQQTEPLNQYAGQLMQETDVSIMYGSGNRGQDETTDDRQIVSLRNALTTVLLDQDFDQALGYFKQLEKSTSLTVEDKYYYAYSLLKSKGEDNQKAIRLLNDVVDEKDHHMENALWLRALAYGMTDNSPLMKKDLKKLITITKKTDNQVNDLLKKY